MAKIQYSVFCDESADKGPFFSDFYGGALVRSADRESIEANLKAKKEELNITSEMKWVKITKSYQEKYIEFIRLYFEYVRTGRIKIRIMFTQNAKRPKNLTDENLENKYFILYYMLLKHAFGFQYSNPGNLDRIFVETFLDEIPHNNMKYEKFRSHISNIGTTSIYRGKNIKFPKDRIFKVDSRDHVILQGLDIILGSMHFRLNDLHKVKPQGQRKRGNRTISKESVYKEINRQIRIIRPNFNIGVSTGNFEGESSRWLDSYRHWCFVPTDHEFDKKAVKPR